MVTNRHDVLGHEEDVDSVAPDLGHAEEDVEQPPDVGGVAGPVTSGRQEGGLCGVSVVQERHVSGNVPFISDIEIYEIPFSDKFLGRHDQGVHAVDGDHGHKHHAEHPAHQASVGDGDGHGQHADPDVPLQQVDDCLDVRNRVCPPALIILTLCLDKTATRKNCMFHICSQ